MSNETNIILPSQWRNLVDASRAARANAYAPFSDYSVGAAVLTQGEHIFAGCNVENSSYGLTICAERAAMCSAIAAGHRDITAVAISLTGVAIPCGTCRQFLYEFNPNTVIVIDDLSKETEETPEAVQLSDLLPRAFRLVTEKE